MLPFVATSFTAPQPNNHFMLAGDSLPCTEAPRAEFERHGGYSKVDRQALQGQGVVGKPAIQGGIHFGAGRGEAAESHRPLGKDSLS